jgi:hypothetical protein
MSDRLPLTEVGGEEILARVVFQIILGDYRQQPDSYDTPTIAILNLADEWFASGFTDVATDLRLAAIWCANGGTVATWLRSRIIFHAGRTGRLIRAGRSSSR